MVPLARRNLFTEKIRFTMSIAGVAFAVLLVLVVASLYRGWSESSEFFTELPGDLWVAQPGTSDPMRATSYLPADGAAALEQAEGVSLVIPVYARRIAMPEAGQANVQFMSFALPENVPGLRAAADRYVPEPGHVAIQDVLADAAGVGVGDRLDVLGSAFVVEHIRPGGNPLFALAFLNAADARPLLGLPGYVSYFVLVLATGTSPDTVAATIPDLLPGSEARTSADYAAAMSATVDEGFLPVVGALVAIGLAIGGAVVALTTYTATIEKARDYAVLKALGASAWFVYRVVIRQSAIVGVAGSLLGVVAASVVATLVRRRVPEFVTDLRMTDAVFVIAATIAISLIAAYVPVRRINRIDPAMVFRA
jgi:putative ABC transport system permease protein